MGITVWHRLEPDSVDEDRVSALDRGVPAPVYDPLWLLARQWQLGEWQGSDGGSIVDAKLAIGATALGDLQAGDRTIPLGTAPLEMMVEAEVRGDDVRTRARGGLQFLALLERENLDYRAATLAKFPLAADGDAAVYAALAEAPDGGAIVAAAAQLVAQLNVATGDRQRFTRVVDELVAWYGVRSTAVPDTWDREHLEHRFEIRADAVRLRSDEYAGGRLDWDAFDVVAPATPARVTNPHDVAPLPVQIPGMPVVRYWQLEDDADLGALPIGPGEAARSVLLEFSLRFASDWFVVPAPVPVAAIVRVDGLIVTDTFGVPMTVPDTLDVRGDTGWRLWALSGGDRLGMLVAPVTDAIDGLVIEELAIARDEQANLAWAHERIVPTSLGRGIEVVAPPRAAEPPSAAELVYRPLPALPAARVPLARQDADDTIWLARATAVTATPAWQPLGTIVTPAFRVFDHEVPYDGIVVTRRYQVARDRAGKLIAWCGRSKRPGVTSPSLRIAFDDLRRSD